MGDAGPKGGGGGGGAVAFFGGANANITVRSNLIGGTGWRGYSPQEGSGGGGDALIVMDGKVKVTTTGVLLGGDSLESMGGPGGGGGAGLYLDKGSVQNAGQITGGMGGINSNANPSSVAPGGRGGMARS